MTSASLFGTPVVNGFTGPAVYVKTRALMQNYSASFSCTWNLHRNFKQTAQYTVKIVLHCSLTVSCKLFHKIFMNSFQEKFLEIHFFVAAKFTSLHDNIMNSYMKVS